MLVVPPSKAPLLSVASVGCATTASFGVWLHKRSPDAARNATGATFAWGPFRPLDFSGPRTPPECEAPPEGHSQLVFAYRLLMGRRYSSRITSAGPLRNLHLGAIFGSGGFCLGPSNSIDRTDDRSDRTASQLLSQREAARRVPNCAQPIILAYGTCASAKICRHSVGVWLYAQLRQNLPTSTCA